MNRWKICSAIVTVALAVGMLYVPASNAQTPSIPIVAVGSSGFFAAAGLAAIKGDPVRGAGPLCGTRFWTGTLTGLDARKATNSSIPNETATSWIAWDNDATPTIICAYMAPDSIIGQRLFFGTDVGGNGTLSIPTSACTTAGANKVAFVWDTATAGLPVAVWNALQGGNATNASCSDNTNTLAPVHFNVAFTDVRSEDAQFVSSQRVFCSDTNSSAFFPPDDKSCMGFGGAGGLGTAISSSYSTSSAHVVSYAYTGTDPISSATIPAAQIVPVGAQTALVFVNTSNNSSGSGGFGDLMSGSYTPNLTNASSHAVGALFSGQAALTRDIWGYSGAPVAVAHALLREPLSGTYTTFEWQIVRQRDGNTAFSQETGILGPSQTGYSSGCIPGLTSTNATTYPSSGNCSNPVNVVVGSSQAVRTRVIGTSQMIAIANTSTLQDSIGYAFWSLGNFGGKANLRYLTLDGVDPLYPAGSSQSTKFPGVVSGQGTVAATGAPAAGQCGGYFNGGTGGITAFSCNGYTFPTFSGVQSGAYRFWNVVQANYYSSTPIAPTFSPLNITGFILSAQNQTNPVTGTLPDIVPTTYCGDSACTAGSYVHPVNYFRSHYTVPTWNIGNACNGVNSTGCNGTTPGVENGGDVAGAAISRQNEIDFGNIFSNSFTSWVQ